MTDTANTPNLMGNLTVTDVARLCYAVDTAYSRAVGGDTGGGTGTGTKGVFDQLPADRREIIVAAVTDILTTPTITPEQIHEKWIARMKSQGWSRGATTNVGARQHALLIPYAELSPQDRIKPQLLLALVQGVMPSKGDQVGAGTLRTEEKAGR